MSFFEIFAECAIAFTGFGAVHAALRGADSPRGIFRAWTVMSQGALAFLLSILPLLLAQSSLAPEQLWRVASTLAVVGVGAMACANHVFDYRLNARGHPPQSRSILRIAQTSTAIGLVAMTANLFEWPANAGPSTYATGVVLVLIAGLLALLHSFLVPLQLVLEPESGHDSEPTTR